MQRRRPLLFNVLRRQINQLEQSHITGKGSLSLGHLPDLAVIVLHGIGGVDELSYGSTVLEVRGQLFPIIAPGSKYNRVFRLPCIGQFIQGQFGHIQCIRFIDPLQVLHERLLVFAGYILERVTDLVDDAALYFRLGVDTQDSFFKAVKVIGTGNQNVFQSTVLQVGEDLKPEVGSFAFGNIAAQYLLIPIPVDSQNVVDSSVFDSTFTAHFIVHGIEPYDTVNRLQWA